MVHTAECSPDSTGWNSPEQPAEQTVCIIKVEHVKTMCSSRLMFSHQASEDAETQSRDEVDDEEQVQRSAQ